jgi:hypothetical protein
MLQTIVDVFPNRRVIDSENPNSRICHRSELMIDYHWSPKWIWNEEGNEV